CVFFFFSSRRRHTRSYGDWSSDVCSSDLEIVGRDLLHEGAAARARLDDAEELQRAQRLAHRCARDLELVRQSALRRQLLARPQLTPLEERLDLLDDALIQPAAADGLDGGQFPASLSVFRGLVRWSDQRLAPLSEGRQG